MAPVHKHFESDLTGTTSYTAYSVSWNLTQRCNLECAHCYMSHPTRSATSRPFTASARDCFSAHLHVGVAVVEREHAARQEVHAADELGDELGGRAVVQVLGGALLNDRALA